MRKFAAIITAGALGLSLAACGDDGGVDTDALKDDLMTDLQLSAEQADCVIEEIGSDADVLLKIIQDESYEPSEADMTNLDRVGDECGLS
ncbi:MAG: hypothetical protein R2770_12335 [Acidimicrobiales bacterium]